MFKKIFIILIISISSSYAEVVKEITIKGNNRISPETIKVYGEIELEKNYSNEQINEILKKLYSTNFFENIDIKLLNGILTINVSEYSVINNITFDGEESKRIKELITSKLNLKPNQSFIPNLLNEDINLIRNLYSSIGYNFTEVEAKLEKFSNNRINLKFNINKGNQIYLKRINFIGDKKIKDSRLREIIASEEDKFWKFLTKNTIYNKSNIELDKRLLVNYYKSIGYYDVQVLSSNSEISEENYINITYTINSGNRYKIKKIATNVDNIIEKKLFLPLSEDFEEVIGKFYSPFKIKKLLERVDYLIAFNDLQFVEHSVNEILDGDDIEIIINIYEGKKQLVEKVNIYGNNVTNESVIRSELLIDEGDPFNKLKIDQSIANLKSRNLFGEVNLQVKDGIKNDSKILDINVTEKPTGEIMAGAGIGTNGGSFAFSVSENNWLGKGIKLSTQLDLSSETFSGGISVVDPNYNFSGNEFSYFVNNIRNDKPDSGYKNNITSAGIGSSFEQFEDIYLAPSLVFSYDDLKVESSASSNLQKQKGTFSDLSFTYGITADKRDRSYGPTEGYITTFNQAIPLYADAPYIRNSISLSKYNSFTPSMIGSFKFYAASINGLRNENVRLSKRLSMPSSRLRGFETGKVGPKDGVDFVGGNYVAASNFELNLPNLLPESTRTDVGLFLDIGNIWAVDYSDTINDSNKIRSSIGFNTNWNSPVGPMSFIFSQNISKASTDITESFNFRLGTTF